MKAIVNEKYGSPDKLVLQEVERPQPGKHEVQIKVLGSALNKADWYLLQGKPFPVRLMAGLFKPKHQILGADVAGIVEKAGMEATQFIPGDEVYGDLSTNGFGGFAEYAVANEKILAQKPSNFSFEQAAALPMASITALQGLRDYGKVKAGQEVLINGASGGVGTFAIQIAKAFGANVTAVCSTTKIEQAKKLGADQVIDYTKENFTLMEKHYDLILDIVGNHSISAIMKVLKAKGIYITCTFSPAVMLLSPWISMISGKRIKSYLANTNQEDLQFIAKLAEEEKLIPVIEKTYTLDDVPEALKKIGSGSTAGKLVISI